MNACCYERSYQKGDSPHQGGERCSGLFVVMSGQLRVYMLSESGREFTLYHLFAGDVCLFSAACVMKNISFDLSVQAQKDTRVYVIPAESYEGLMKESLPVADYTNQLMAARFSDAMRAMEQSLFTSLDKRLAAFLLEQSGMEGGDVLSITHEQIAGHLGSAWEVITKMLHELAARGMVKLSRGKIRLLDKKKLADLAA